MVRVWQSWQNVAGRYDLIVPALLVLAVCGCKSSSWSSRPAWMGGSAAGSSLTSAPSFNGGIAKPSETAKPYPTTSTPDGYVLNESTRPDSPKTPSTSPSAVTYGSTPPPSMTPAAAAPPTSPATVAAQVGPYAPLQPSPFTHQPTPPADPAGAVTAGLAAAPAFGGSPASPPPPAADRFADARGGGWGGSPPAQPPTTAQPSAPMTAPPSDSRYGNATASRFSAGVQPAEPMPLPQWSPTPPPAAAEAAPPAAPAMPTPPADGALPGAIPPPTRRPDPGYRPGGTSSYRPTRSLLAGENEMNPVQPVSFDAPPQ